MPLYSPGGLYLFFFFQEEEVFLLSIPLGIKLGNNSSAVTNRDEGPSGAGFDLHNDATAAAKISIRSRWKTVSTIALYTRHDGVPTLHI